MLVAVLVFLVVFVLYIHIQDQWKRSEDLEVYEMDYSTREHLQTVCAMKQPVLFALPFEHRFSPDVTKDSSIGSDGKAAEIPVWDVREYGVRDSVDPFWLSYASFTGLTKSDPKGHFYSRKNQEWLEATSTAATSTAATSTAGGSNHREVDEWVRPPLTVHSRYELLKGSEGAHTPLAYHMDDRQYFFVTKGKISVRMTPWRSGRYLNPVADYDNYEFFSQVDPWTCADKDVRWLDFEVMEGYVLFIPAWWWYSIRFFSVDTEVLGAHYITGANVLAHTVDWGRYYAQYHMTQRIPTKRLESAAPIPPTVIEETPLIEELTEGHKEIISPVAI
jgi:hypothetical protein